MIKPYTTILIDMYGVILEESKGNFLPYVYNSFPESEYQRITDIISNQKMFTKAQLGEVTSYEFLSALGFKDTEKAMKEYIQNHLTLDKGFIPFAEKIKDKYKLVLVSNDIPEWSEYITEYFGINKYFLHKIISGSVGARKPDFKIFDDCLEIIGARPAECILVDNSAKNLVAAEEMGISPVLFDRDGEHFCGATVLNFEELYNFIG